MKLSPSVLKEQKGKREVPPPISMERPKAKTLSKGEYIRMNLTATTGAEKDTSYTVDVPYFKNGTPEEWFLFLQMLDRIYKGQNLTTGPQRFVIVRELLQGEALAQFNRKAAEVATQTIASLKVCLQEVTNYVLPRRALQIQRRYMRQISKKPQSQTIKEYMARYEELNTYLTLFNGDGERNRIPDDDLKEHLEWAIPTSWQVKMIEFNFNFIENDLTDVIEFIERMEQSAEL